MSNLFKLIRKDRRLQQLDNRSQIIPTSEWHSGLGHGQRHR